jgi:hypothetical protein
MDFKIKVIKINFILLTFTSIDREYLDYGNMYTVRGFILSRFQEILKTVTKSRSMIP